MLASSASTENRAQQVFGNAVQLVTMRVDSQLFGIEVRSVRDVLHEQAITPIPLAPREVSGSLNLRGRIVTVVDLRKRLGLPSEDGHKNMFVVVEHHHELFSLKVDSVGEVLNIAQASIEKSPANLSGKWRDVAEGVCRLEEELLVIMDVQALLNFSN